jgi:YHS domain-containing protein
MGNVNRASLLILGILFFAFTVAGADKPKAELKPLCPVSGKPIDKNVSIDYHNGKVYFSNAEAEKKFQDNVEKYAARANLQLVVTGQAQQTACPLMSKPVVAGKSVMVSGVKVELCCNICKTKLTKAKPEEQLEMVFGKGFDKGYTVKKA